MFKTILSDIFLWVLNLFPFEIIYIDKIRIFGAEAPRMEEKNSFAQLLEKNRIPIERYIHYRIPAPHDAEDVIQETYLAAFRHFSELRSQTLFKQWMLQIAKNQCNLWFRNTHRHSHLSLDMMDSMEYSFDSPQGGSVQEILRNLVLQHQMKSFVT